MGQLVFQATLGGQVNLVGPNTASTFNINVPAVAGNMVTTGDTGTVTNTMLAGSIANAKLTNSSVTIGSTSVSLGATSTTLDGVNIGATTPGTGAFTTLSASSTVSGTGFSTYLASPPAIGGTAAAAGSFTALSYTTTLTGGTGIVNLGSGQFYKDASGNVGIGTSSPSVKLDIGGSANNAVRIASSASVATTAGAAYCLFGGSNNINSGFLGYVGVANQMTLMNGLAGEITFGTSNTERMRIDSSGNLLVGTTSTSIGNINGYVFNAGGALNIYRTSGASQAMIGFGNNGNFVGDIRTSTTLTSYNVSSDYRLKENIAPLTGALDKISALKPSVYNYKADPTTQIEGFIAHELQAVVPHAVHGEKDAVDDNGNPIYQGVDASFLIPHLVAAIQELKAEVDALKAVN